MRLFSSTIHWASFSIELMLQDLYTSRTRGANSCLLGEPGETRLERLSQLRTGMRAVSSAAGRKAGTTTVFLNNWMDCIVADNVCAGTSCHSAHSLRYSACSSVPRGRQERPRMLGFANDDAPEARSGMVAQPWR